MQKSWDCYLPPIRMAAGVYYVSGNDWVGSYLIETEEGLILIRTRRCTRTAYHPS